MRNFVSPGDMVDITTPAAVNAGDVVVLSNLFGVSAGGYENSSAGVIATKGLFDLRKNTGAGTSLAVGALVYVSGTGAPVTASATSNTRVGVVVRAAANADTSVRVRLDQ